MEEKKEVKCPMCSFKAYDKRSLIEHLTYDDCLPLSGKRRTHRSDFSTPPPKSKVKCLSPATPKPIEGTITSFDALKKALTKSTMEHGVSSDFLKVFNDLESQYPFSVLHNESVLAAYCNSLTPEMKKLALNAFKYCNRNICFVCSGEYEEEYQMIKSPIEPKTVIPYDGVSRQEIYKFIRDMFNSKRPDLALSCYFYYLIGPKAKELSFKDFENGPVCIDGSYYALPETFYELAGDWKELVFNIEEEVAKYKRDKFEIKLTHILAGRAQQEIPIVVASQDMAKAIAKSLEMGALSEFKKN